MTQHYPRLQVLLIQILVKAMQEFYQVLNTKAQQNFQKCYAFVISHYELIPFSAKSRPIAKFVVVYVMWNIRTVLLT